MSYRYIKVSPVTITVPVFPFLSLVVGTSILFWVLGPMIFFTLVYATVARGTVTPLSETAPLVVGDAAEKVDFSKASNWFPNVSAKKTNSLIDSYTISIPKLGIENALVTIGSDDLSKNLIHYGGTGIPGKEGNTVIFGHSTLPSFYDTKNYMTIFSLLPTLGEGDDVFVHFDGVDYRYQVIDKKITSPEDVSGLEQRFDASYLTLVTCVPPGTYWKREWITLKQRAFGAAAKKS